MANSEALLVELNYLGPNFIDVVIMKDDMPNWRLTGIYGHPAWNKNT